MRPRKSLETHALQSTRPHYDKDEAADDSKQFTGGRLKMPAAFRGTDKGRIWKQIFNPLQRRKTLTKADSAGAIVLVEMWARWEKVAALAEANPCTDVCWTDSSGTVRTKVVEHPACKMATQLEGRIVIALKEFSATPASRAKTKPTKQAAPKNTPPPPDSYEGLALELQRLRAAESQPEEALPEEFNDNEEAPEVQDAEADENN